jgi:nucleoside-diphosphate-sugar epimerase
VNLASVETLRGRTVLVTGGSGFIGCRLVERLIERHGARVRVLVRDVGRASRVATFPVEIVRGSILDGGAMQRAAQGCDTIFHCAYGTAGSQGDRARTNLDGTRRVLEAALAVGARRVVDLSTLMVYGETAAGDLDETAPRRRFGDPYADSKRAAERLAVRWAGERGLPVVILQPTAVYGPYGGVWTELPLRQLATGRVPLIDHGRGLANAVYVDDLVSAMLLAATRDGVEGEAFLISGAESEPWSDFYARFEAMLDVAKGSRLHSMSIAEARSLWRRHRWQLPSLARVLGSHWRSDETFRRELMASREVVMARNLASQLPEGVQQFLKRRAKAYQERRRTGFDAAASSSAPTLPTHPPSPRMIAFFSARTRVRIDKARRLLGYEPEFSLDRGMALTAAWARWANVP